MSEKGVVRDSWRKIANQNVQSPVNDTYQGRRRCLMGYAHATPNHSAISDGHRQPAASVLGHPQPARD
jgi:hypothetical protein